MPISTGTKFMLTTNHFNQICRSCFNQQDLTLIEGLNIAGEVPIKNILFHCFQIKVTVDDQLPQYICSACVGVLDGFHKFWNRCHTYDTLFRTVLNKSKITPSNDSSRNGLLANERPLDIDTILHSIEEHFRTHGLQTILRQVQNESGDEANCSVKSESFDYDETSTLNCSTGKPMDNNRSSLEALSLIKSSELNRARKPYKCSSCKRTFWSRKSLNIHMRFHQNIRSLWKNENIQKSQPVHCIIGASEQRQDQNVDKYTTFVTDVPRVCSIATQTEAVYDVVHSSNLNNSTLPDNEELSVPPNSTIFTCTQCQQIFFSKNTLDAHLQLHDTRKIYKCAQCTKSFSITSDLLQHMQTHRGERLYKCDFCSASFREDGALKTHLLGDHICEKNAASCTSNQISLNHNKIDKKQYVKNDRYNRHSKKAKVFKCHKCKLSFSNSKDLLAHQNIRHPQLDKQFHCHLCPRRFAYEACLDRHLMHHASVLLNKPSDNTFETSSRNLRSSTLNSIKHEKGKEVSILYPRAHAADDTTAANICSQRKLSNKIHIQKNISINVKKSSDNVNVPRMQVQLNTKRNAFICHVCNRSYITEKFFKKHTKIHRGQKNGTHDVLLLDPALNPLTSKTKSIKARGKPNILVGFNVSTAKKTKPKLRKCEICQFTFENEKRLNEHALLHLNRGTLYNCDSCEKAYRQKKHLDAHKRIVHKNNVIFVPRKNGLQNSRFPLTKNKSQCTKSVKCTHPSKTTKLIVKLNKRSSLKELLNKNGGAFILNKKYNLRTNKK